EEGEARRRFGEVGGSPGCPAGATAQEETPAKTTAEIESGLRGVIPAGVPEDLDSDAFSALDGNWQSWSENTAALVAAEAAVREGRFVQQYAREVVRNRQELARALAALGIKFFPSGGNFVLGDFGPRAPTVLRRLRQRGILARDRQADFGRVGLVRITVGTRAQMRRLIRALRELWKS
ncbi:MAG: aminotransferase class I/II-fold pyridoxal phosphate-dependent enzyme, partial [Acidobacteria bacterium]|nr:aminotransferase class I/II-fold pyridoxal phosphate-dependent enzyme [Acidobacteriota bacterium]